MSTARQQQLIEAIRAMNADGVPITYERLRERLGLASRGGVNRLLNLLKAEGRVVWNPRQHGSLRLIEGPTVPQLECLPSGELLRVRDMANAILADRDAGRAAA